MKYRKKPVVIDAWQIMDINSTMTMQLPPPWLINALQTKEIQPGNNGGLYVDTKEGRMTGNIGDWIIRGVEGEFYPCKDSVFQVSYEKV